MFSQNCSRERFYIYWASFMKNVSHFILTCGWLPRPDHSSAYICLLCYGVAGYSSRVSIVIGSLLIDGISWIRIRIICGVRVQPYGNRDYYRKGDWRKCDQKKCGVVFFKWHFLTNSLIPCFITTNIDGYNYEAFEFLVASRNLDNVDSLNEAHSYFTLKVHFY